MYGIGTTELMIYLFGLIFILPFWNIFKKAGFPGWLSLLILIPILSVLNIYFLAFAKWPALKK